MKQKKAPFYEPGYCQSQLSPGSWIAVRRELRYIGANADFKPFLTVPIKELEQRLKDSTAEEKKIHNEVEKAIKAWDVHGTQTLLLQKAIEYLKTPPVKHTGNEWTQQTDGTWEISNLVYKMTFKIVPFGEEWKLSWELEYTAPGPSYQPSYYYGVGPRKRIEHESSKKYKTMAGAQKYVQSKFDQYVSCFETLSPPIPEAAKPLFCVNGQLLQGYTVAQKEPEVSPEKAKEETVAELLEFLEDDEVSDTPPEQAAPPPAVQGKPPIKESPPAPPSQSPKPPAAKKNQRRKRARAVPAR